MTDNEQTRFDRFAEATSRFVSEAAFFIVSVVVVVVWLPTIVVFNDVNTWQLVINTATSILAFLLVALLQNSERRYDLALHRKVDAIARGLVTLMEHQEHGDSSLERSIDELCSTVGIEQRV